MNGKRVSAALLAAALAAWGCGEEGPPQKAADTEGVAPASAPASAMHAHEHGPEPVLTAQALCPVMGGEINKDLYADHNGKRVYFCCPGCIPEFKKDPEKYLKKLQAEGVGPEKAPAPPVHGHEPGHAHEH